MINIFKSLFFSVGFIFLIFNSHATAAILEIDCYGLEANVFIDGKLKGICPVTVLVSPGKHMVSVKRVIAEHTYWYIEKEIAVADDISRHRLSLKAKKVVREEYFLELFNKNRIGDYEEYLNQFPQGKYAKLAQEKVEYLIYMETDSIEGCKLYIKRYPKGKYISEVLQKAGNRLKYVTDIIRLTLRTGPSTDYKILAVLESGQQVRILRQEADWSKVKTEEGQDGWVLSRYLVQYPAQKQTDSGYIDDHVKLTIRSGPSADYKILAVLDSGQQVEILKEEVGWTQVKTDEGLIGWMISRFLIERPSDRWCTEGQCFNGAGTYLNLGGIKYTGEFKNGLKHGKGTMVWPNGAKYIGEFQNGQMHGQGTMSYAGGSVVSGNFQNGNLVAAE